MEAPLLHNGTRGALAVPPKFDWLRPIALLAITGWPGAAYWLPQAGKPAPTFCSPRVVVHYHERGVFAGLAAERVLNR